MQQQPDDRIQKGEIRSLGRKPCCAGSKQGKKNQDATDTRTERKLFGLSHCYEEKNNLSSQP
jgi:hypothetical protein